MKKTNSNKRVQKLLYTLILPVAAYLIMEAVCQLVVGRHVLGSVADVKNLLRSVATTFCIALALSTNLMVGRMDFSIGAQMIMGTIIGSNLAIRMGLGGLGALLLSMVMGLFAGLVVGFVFIKTKILPMVTGIGMALIYESLSFLVFKGNGVNYFGVEGIAILSNLGFILAVMAVLIVAATYFFQYSTFGYNRRAVQGSQRIAHNAGINIYHNAVVCYMIAGALVTAAGVFDTAYKGHLAPALNMASIGSVFTNLFPVFLGMFIGQWSNPIVGTFVASVALRMVTIGLSKLPISQPIQTCITVSLLLIFTVFDMNRYRFELRGLEKARIAQAKEKRLQIGKSVMISTGMQ